MYMTSGTHEGQKQVLLPVCVVEQYFGPSALMSSRWHVYVYTGKWERDGVMLAWYMLL